MTIFHIHIPNQIFVYFLLALVIFSVFFKPLIFRKKRRKKAPTMKKGLSTNVRSSNILRSDEVILSSPIDDLSWREFERLFAMYFRSLGHEVLETGVGGNDGGVDLVVIDRKTNQRTAVQLKHHKKAIGPEIVRALEASKRNTTPTCLFAHLITSADVTSGTRDEAEKRNIGCWHAGNLEHYLSKWKDWHGNGRPLSKRRYK